MSNHGSHGKKKPTLKPKDGKSWRDSYYHKLFGLKAAEEAEKVLPIFEKERPKDNRPRQAIEAIAAWANGKRELKLAEVRKLSLDSHAAAREAKADAARFAARAAGQAVATWHVPTHALGAVMYSQKAICASVNARSSTKPPTAILSKCGYRCDLCLAYGPNVAREDRRALLSDGWHAIFGFRIPPEKIVCDGCVSGENPRLIDKGCPVRPCVAAKGLDNCGHCPDFVCGRLGQRIVERAELEKKIGRKLSETEYVLFVMPYESQARLDKAKSKSRSKRGFK
jgi:hypothetical protein